MRAGADKNYLIVSPQLIDKKEISPDVAFPVVRPLASERMIVEFRWQSAFDLSQFLGCFARFSRAVFFEVIEKFLPRTVLRLLDRTRFLH